MERRQSGLGRCSMLPISVGLPLILFGKKRPKRRRLESGRPRGGSAAAGFAGRAVVDPAIPAHSRGLAAGTSRFSRARPRAAACPARRVGRAVDGRRTASRPSLVSLVLSEPAAAGSSPGRPCGAAARTARGPQDRCRAARSPAPRGRSRRPLSAGLAFSRLIALPR